MVMEETKNKKINRNMGGDRMNNNEKIKYTTLTLYSIFLLGIICLIFLLKIHGW